MVTQNLSGRLLLNNREHRLRELEILFADWANSIEDCLINYDKKVKNKLDDSLVLDLDLYCGQLREIKAFDIEYKMLSFSTISNPDYARAINHLQNILYLVKSEFNRRNPGVY
jgi:hypothetical protein